MRIRLALAVLAGVVSAAACGGTSVGSLTTAPSFSSAAASVPLDSTRLGFSGLATDGAPVTSYAESGFQVSVSAGDWRARTTYGNPLPFIQFGAEPGTTVTGAVQIALPAPTYLASIDLYSSTTTIPYVIKGLRNAAVVFTLSGTVPNTFGTFRTITNPNDVVVDAVSITLTNTAAACCRNPMGFDNLVTSHTPTPQSATYALTGAVTDNATGAAVSGARVSIASGVNIGASTTTNTSGAYTFPALTEGPFHVSVTATDYLSGVASGQLSANQALAVRLTRDPRVATVVASPAGATTIGFGGLSEHGAGVSRYVESGFTIATSSADWVASTAYGHPAPFIQFYAEPSNTVIGHLDITGGSAFTFFSAELYSSTTRIPYTMTGTLNGAPVFTVTGELPNTFGALKQVVNPYATNAIDRLSIALTNAAAACCRNPVGIDTIVVVR